MPTNLRYKNYLRISDKLSFDQELICLFSFTLICPNVCALRKRMPKQGVKVALKCEGLRVCVYVCVCARARACVRVYAWQYTVHPKPDYGAVHP